MEIFAGLSQLFLPLHFTFPWRSNQKANLHLHGTFIITILFLSSIFDKQQWIETWFLLGEQAH